MVPQILLVLVLGLSPSVPALAMWGGQLSHLLPSFHSLLCKMGGGGAWDFCTFLSSLLVPSAVPEPLSRDLLCKCSPTPLAVLVLLLGRILPTRSQINIPRQLPRHLPSDLPPQALQGYLLSLLQVLSPGFFPLVNATRDFFPYSQLPHHSLELFGNLPPLFLRISSCSSSLGSRAAFLSIMCQG